MRKFTGIILGVFILCFAAVANTANEHPAKAEHFSMLELNRKLSKLILNKYPNSHVDVSLYAISACDAAFNKDSTIQQLPCSDPRIKPRPDSAEFKFNLMMQFDITHYRQTQSSAEVSGDSLTTIEKRYNIGTIPKVEDTSPADVPLAGYGSWAYGAFTQLVEAGVAEDFLRHTTPTVLASSRYEFAIAIARLLDHEDKRAKDSQKVKVLIDKLAIGFEPEMSKIGLRINKNQYIKELADNGIIWQPRYRYLELDSSYGKQFDPKLRKQIEDTITDYTAAWLKSNSSTAVATQK